MFSHIVRVTQEAVQPTPKGMPNTKVKAVTGGDCGHELNAEAQRNLLSVLSLCCSAGFRNVTASPRCMFSTTLPLPWRPHQQLWQCHGMACT